MDDGNFEFTPKPEKEARQSSQKERKGKVNHIPFDRDILDLIEEDKGLAGENQKEESSLGGSKSKSIDKSHSSSG